MPPEKYAELVHIVQSVPGSAIVYVRSRRRTREISDELMRNGINADFYHAGLNIEDKEAKQTRWKNDELRVIVATNAFGMGIDKPDVRSDMEKIMNHMVKENEPYYDHVFEGADDMPAHAKCSLFGVSITIPITNGRLNLGTWQGIYLCEFRDYGGARKIVATIYE